jgi:hypothetical protein
MRTLLVFGLLLIFTINCKAGETVRIDFFPGAPEEFDIFFKKGFESIGYSAFVNYFDRSASRPYDLLFKYEWVDNTLKVFLYSNSGELQKKSEKKFIYFDRIETMTYLFLGEYLDKMINVKDRRGRLKGAAGRISAKLDSAVYIIQAEGKGNSIVRDLFLEAGRQLTCKFRAYYDISKYQGESFHALIFTPFFGTRIMGIIIGDTIEGQNFVIMDTSPEIYTTYLSELAKDLKLPADDLGDVDLSRLYLTRKTGHIASELPFTVFIDGFRSCYLNNEKYAVFIMSPGKHTIIVQVKSELIDPEVIPLNIKVMPSQNIYLNVLMDSNDGLMCQEEKEYAAKIMVQDLTSDDCHSMK